MLEDQIMPLIPSGWQEEILYYIHLKDNQKENADTKPLDSQIIEACDHFAAYIEAVMSYKHGITSRHLEDARKNLYQQYRKTVIGNIHFGKMFEYFS